MNRQPSPETADSSDRQAEATGLPWPRTWRGVYFFVLASFCLWLGLLIGLTLLYP